MKNTRLQLLVTYAILAVGVIHVLLPLYSIVAVSMQPGAASTGGFDWPDNPTLENYVTVWTSQNFGQMLLNSVVVGLLVVLLTLCAAILAGYAFAYLQFPGKKFIFPLLLIGIAVPFEGLVVPLYFILRSLGLTDNLFSVAAAEAGLYVSFGILWMRTAFDGVPAGVLDAAKMDGASQGQTLWQIALPITWPSVSTLGILYFVWSWKEFLVALVLLQSQSNKTAPAGLSAFAGQYVVQVPQIAAAAVVVSLPVVVIFLILQKQMIRGLTQGAVKG